MTGLPVCNAKPAGDAKSAPTVAETYNSLAPADARAYEQPIVCGKVFQDFAIFCLKPFRRKAHNMIQKSSIKLVP